MAFRFRRVDRFNFRAVVERKVRRLQLPERNGIGQRAECTEGDNVWKQPAEKSRHNSLLPFRLSHASR
jgi:hypothetical protein